MSVDSRELPTLDDARELCAAAEGLVGQALERARSVTEGGKQIDAHQVLAERVAYAATEARAARELVAHAAEAAEQGRGSALRAATAAAATAELAARVRAKLEASLEDLGLDEAALEAAFPASTRALLRRAGHESVFRALGRHAAETGGSNDTPLEDTLEQVRVHGHAEVDLAKLPPDDPATYAMIRRADTIGTFQIESRAQMATLPRMKPERFYDLVVEVAIIRPGPITGKLVHPYLERRAGRQPVVYPHPSLEPILSRTLGVPLFQEQLLRIAMTAAGFSGGEAEELRRAMGFKRSVERMSRIEEKLVAGMSAQGIGPDAQQEILRGITSFALYGFPESHAASFALIAYASAWLRRHHPAAFLAGLLNAQPMGFYSAATLVQDAQRHGVEVRPIDVARSAWRSALERAGDAPPAVRLGLCRVAGLREPTAQRLVAERARRPFASAADLAARVRPAREELAALAELGALAGVDPAASTRRSALWQVSALAREPLLAAARPPDEPSPLPEMSEVEQTLADYRGSGVTTGAHLMAHLREGLDARGVLSAAALRALPDGRFVRTAGHVIVRQRPGTAKGFCFLTLEDETGTSNAVLTPDAFARFRDALHAASLLELAGPLQNVEGVIHVRVRELRPLAPGGGLPRSHDYR